MHAEAAGNQHLRVQNPNLDIEGVSGSTSGGSHQTFVADLVDMARVGVVPLVFFKGMVPF